MKKGKIVKAGELRRSRRLLGDLFTAVLLATTFNIFYSNYEPHSKFLALKYVENKQMILLISNVIGE
jgi:hypothetical protein